MPYFPIDFAYLVGSWVEAILWGVFGVLFALCIWLSYKSDRINGVQLLALVVLYILGTTHVGLNFTRLIQGFMFTPSGDERILYFSNVTLAPNVAKDFIYITMLWMSDSILVWRCWIVWKRSLLIITVPIIMLLAEAGVGYAAIGKYVSPGLTTDASVKPLGTAMFTISLSTNIIVSSLIAGRIWWISRQASKLVSDGRHGTQDALRLVIESGLAITSAKIIEFTCYEVSFARPSDVEPLYTVFEAMPQIFGIIPTLILLSIQLKVIPSESPRSNGFKSTIIGSLPLHSKEAAERRSLQRSAPAFERKTSDMPIVSVETAVFKDDDSPHTTDIEMSDRGARGSEGGSGTETV